MKTRLAAALILGLALLAPASAQQDNATPEPPLEGPPLDRAIRYHFDDSNLTWRTWWYGVKVRQAFSWWENDPENFFKTNPRFERVERNQSPDIVLWFRDAPQVGETCNNAPTALGCANTTNGGRLWSLEIRTQRDDGEYLSYRTIGDVAKHEIGHALFLPHVNHPESIMRPALDTTGASSSAPVRNYTPLLLGVAFLLLVIVGGSIVIKKQFSRDEDAEWVPLADQCPANPDTGEHQIERGSVLINDEWAWCDVCRACRGSRPVEPRPPP